MTDWQRFFTRKRYRQNPKLVEAITLDVFKPEPIRLPDPFGGFKPDLKVADAPTGVEPPADTPRVDNRGDGSDGIPTIRLPDLPEPVEIPDKMWIGALVGALLAPRYAHLFAQSPLLWQQSQNEARQRAYAQQVARLREELGLTDTIQRMLDRERRYALDVENLALARERAETDKQRAETDRRRVDAYAQSVEFNRERWDAEFRHKLEEAERRHGRETVQSMLDAYRLAGDPAVDMATRETLLRIADERAERLGVNATEARKNLGIQPSPRQLLAERELEEQALRMKEIEQRMKIREQQLEMERRRLAIATEQLNLSRARLSLAERESIGRSLAKVINASNSALSAIDRDIDFINKRINDLVRNYGVEEEIETRDDTTNQIVRVRRINESRMPNERRQELENLRKQLQNLRVQRQEIVNQRKTAEDNLRKLSGL